MYIALISQPIQNLYRGVPVLFGYCVRVCYKKHQLNLSDVNVHNSYFVLLNTV